MVEPGQAVDCCGQEIVLTRPEVVPLAELVKQAWGAEHGDEPMTGTHPIQLCLQYAECATEDVPAVYADCSCDDACRPNRIVPEEVLLPWVSMKLNRPIKWIEDRLEHFFATTHERGQIHDAEMALTRDGRILGIKDVFLHDGGAYDPYGLTVPINSQCTLLGPYVVPNYDSTFTQVFTNLTLVTPYRGAGRQHGVFVMERLLDFAAHELNIDRAEIRRRNLIPADAFPYKNEIIFQDFQPLEYDSGNYEPVLDMALEAIGYKAFREEQAAARRQGRHLGIGVACYVEGTGIGPYEGAKVQVQSNGKVSIATGIGTQGQGHFTVFAQIAADQLGVAVTDVDVVTGDTDQFYWGAGTFASRGAVVAGNAVNEASKVVRKKALKLASDLFECAEEDLVLEDGKVSIVGIPEKFVSLGDLARQANPMRGAVQPGTEPGLESTQYFGPPMGATANGVHAMIVEMDPRTFDLEILKYVVVHDCGTVINPMILAGQIHGGVAQGIGNAFYEKLVFDDQGQLLNASLADYLLPTATRSAADGARPHRDEVAAQPDGHQGRRRSRGHSGRAAVRAGDRGRARPGAPWRRIAGDSAQPEPAVRTDPQRAALALLRMPHDDPHHRVRAARPARRSSRRWSRAARRCAPSSEVPRMRPP